MDMVATKANEETQKYGKVKCVFRNVGQGQFARSTVWALCGVAQCLPTRLASLHYCYDNVVLRPLLGLFTLVTAGTFVRARMRAHYGESTSQMNGFTILERQHTSSAFEK